MSWPAAAWRPLTDKVSNDKHRRSAAALGKASPRASAVLSTMKSNQWLSRQESNLPSFLPAAFFQVLIACTVSATPHVVAVGFFFGLDEHLERVVGIWIQEDNEVLVYLSSTQQLNSKIWFLTPNNPDKRECFISLSS